MFRHFVNRVQKCLLCLRRPKFFSRVETESESEGLYFTPREIPLGTRLQSTEQKYTVQIVAAHNKIDMKETGSVIIDMMQSANVTALI